jgi:hypothetical protein
LERNGSSQLPDEERLDAAFKLAKSRRRTSLAPALLYASLDGLKPIEHRRCRIHGDLNVRNVFVRWNAIDTVLIDFSHSGAQGSLARDLAKLETSVALTAKSKRGALLSLQSLRQIYRSPLLPFNRLDEDGDARVRAIRQIRREGGGDGIGNSEYNVLAACHLIRYASEPLDSTEDTSALKTRRAEAGHV